MMRRPKPGENEDDLLRWQEEFLKEKSKSEAFQPAAQVTNLRGVISEEPAKKEPTKRASTSATGARKPSKYAQSKGLKTHAEKKPRFDSNKIPVVGDIIEKNVAEPSEKTKPEDEDDKVYFPKVMPKLLGDIVEKNLNNNIDLESFPMPSEGFPVVRKRDSEMDVERNTGLESNSIHSKNTDDSMNMEEASSSKDQSQSLKKNKNLPSKSFILSSKDANDIHNENLKILGKMSEEEILQERQKLLSSLDPRVIEFIKAKRIASPAVKQTPQVEEQMDTDPEPQSQDNDTLWENDVLSHPQVHKWMHFDTLERDKLEWMKGIEESKQAKSDEPYEARFNFSGYLLPYTLEYTEETKSLFHHGEESHRPGYSLTELFELSRSIITQQRVMALNTIAGVLEYYMTGTYKDVVEIPLSKIFFVTRIALDENKTIILEPALKAMRNLLYNRIDEASLDALIGFEEGTHQPCLENDKSEIEELDSKESEFTDFHLAEIDIITALLRTDIIQRLYYILEVVKPSFNCVQYAMQILIRLARDSEATASLIVNCEHLMKAILNNFVPETSINFMFNTQMVYNGKPILAALKLLRILSLQSREIGELLTTKYYILRPISEYVSSGVDGTYGLRIQIESLCILSNLLSFGLGADSALSLCPVVITAVYKHVQGTDITATSSIPSATHAAVVLQFVNKFLTCNINLESQKHQLYPLLKEGTQKWLLQLSNMDSFTCGHLRLICAILDCCKTMVKLERLPMKFLNDSLKIFSISRGYKEIVKHLVASSNLLSYIDKKHLHFTSNLMSLGASVINTDQKVLPILRITSPVPFLASLFQFFTVLEEKDVTNSFIESLIPYLKQLSQTAPSLSVNWFTRIETSFVFSLVQLCVQNNIAEVKKDLIYAVANKLCYILRIDNKFELEYLFNNVVFNKDWFTAERLMQVVSLSDGDGFLKVLSSIDDVKQCYSNVINLNYKDTGPNIVLKKWQEPILPRDWIYLPILMLYSKSQETETTPKVYGEHAKRIEQAIASEKQILISCSLEWILFNELCFPDLLNDIDATDRFCRIMCVFLCDNSLFLSEGIKILLHKCTQILFKKKSSFNFDKPLTGLHNFQDFYTQFLEQFQSVSYGDHTFAACVLVPLAQRHNVKWRKLLWSEYAGCLRALHCPEQFMCYDLKDYLYPVETDESLIKSYYQALSSNLLRPNTIAHKIASHHAQEYNKVINT